MVFGGLKVHQWGRFHSYLLRWFGYAKFGQMTSLIEGNGFVFCKVIIIWLCRSFQLLKSRWQNFFLCCSYSYAGTWTDKNKDRDERRSGSTSNQLPSTKDYLGDFMVWRPPVDWEKNRAFWVGFSLWLGLVGAALFLQRWKMHASSGCPIGLQCDVILGVLNTCRCLRNLCVVYLYMAIYHFTTLYILFFLFLFWFPKVKPRDVFPTIWFPDPSLSFL